MSEVRVRFAPSPTGFFHIGSARTALFNWLYARHTGGTFILRIEDTDKQRNTTEALQVIFDGMRWLGMQWDEGPEAGGDHGPYFQSQRDGIYQEYIQKLRDSDRLYEKDGAGYFRISGEPQVIVDAVRGRVERTEEKDFVVVRSDGSPVFHLVNVIDDITMKISHVIRGEDHLSNTSKHTELFKAFGAPLPTFAHIPLILKENGPGKMSKRDKGALIEDYRRRWFLPEAVRNYLCLLGWSPKDDREVMAIEEIIRIFDLPQINQNNARFDEKKLSFINSRYLHELGKESFLAMGRTALQEAGLVSSETEAGYVDAVLDICQEKLRSVEDLGSFSEYFFDESYAFDEKAAAKIFKKGDPRARVAELKEALVGSDDFSESALEALVQGLAETHETPTGDYIHACRLAVSGRSVGPSFYGLLRVLGKERVLTRMDRFLANAAIPNLG
jgi:glutamyl-tRNA synthetase